MLISCHGCGTKYSIADHKIRGRSARVQCRRCSTVLEVRWDGGTSQRRKGFSRAPAQQYGFRSGFGSDDDQDPETRVQQRAQPDYDQTDPNMGDMSPSLRGSSLPSRRCEASR
jgi:predicted Zn finger-like uncharacterized protein